MPTSLEDRLRLARPNAGGPTLEATTLARERALEALPAHRHRTRVVVAAAAIAAATAAVLAVELRSGAEVASAAQVRAAVSQTLASASNLSGTLVIEEPQPDGTAKTQRWSFALDSGGDVRFKGLDTEDDLAVDGATDTLKFSAGHVFSTIRNLSPPASAFSPDWMLEREVGSVITALASDENAQVQDVEYDGRPAWLLTIRADLKDGMGIAEREIVVDRALGLPVHDVLRNGGTLLGEWSLENLSVDQKLAPDTFTLEPRPHQETESESQGSRRVDPKTIEQAAGYAPLVPSWLPDGYRFDHATLSPTYTAAGDLAGNNIATFVYRRGLEELTVTMRPPSASTFGFAGASRFCTTRSISAIVCANTGQELNSHDVTLDGGALAGQTAKVTIDIDVPPTLAVELPNLDVQVSGDADEAELTRIADSFVR